MSDPIPVAVLALEPELPPADVLAHRYADRLVVDYIGRQALPRDVAKHILAAARAEIEARRVRDAERKQADRAQSRAEVHAQRAALAARAERQRGLVSQGASAAEVMMLGGAETVDDRNRRASRKMDAWMHGKSEGWMYQPQKG